MNEVAPWPRASCAPAHAHPRIAILIHRIGPYHRARLRALAGHVPVAAIETCAMDMTYAWSQESEEDGFSRFTLFSTEAEAADVRGLRLSVETSLLSFAPDVVAVPGWADPAGLLAQAWARRRKVPVITMSDTQDIDAPRQYWKEALKRAVVSLSDAGFVAGHRHADYLSRLGMPRDRITVGYDVVDNAHFARGAKAARINPDRASQLRLAEPAFLVVARFVPRKNLAALVRAHARYAREAKVARRTPWKLVLVGDGPERGALLAAAHPGVEVRPFAQYEELPALYGLAGALVVPSLVEQWGLVVNEAMAAGCPVIVSDRAGAATELVEDGVTGFITAPNERALARALGRMADCPHRELIARAGQRRMARWGLERFTAGILEAAAKAQPRRRSPFPLRLLDMIARRRANPGPHPF